VAICGSGVGACVVANKVPGRACGVDHGVLSAHQGVEDDDMNVCVWAAGSPGRLIPGSWSQTFLRAQFKGDERFRRRLAKVAALEGEKGSQ